MDQQAFRQLLSTPKPTGSTKTGNDNDPSTSKSSRSFGLKNKRSIQSTPSYEGSFSSTFAPRKAVKIQSSPNDHRSSSSTTTNAKKNSSTGEVYVDRAEARRLGKEDTNEFKDVEALHDDFEKRIQKAENEEERGKLREQMAFLGGDAKHSILVKGLDFALLEQQRAKGTISQSTNDDEDLENAYANANDSHHSKISISPLSSSAHEKAGVQQTRSTQESEEAIDKAKRLGKFKPIGNSGFQSVNQRGPSKGEDEAPEYIWRDGKRMRKKKKRKVEKEEDIQDQKVFSRPSGSRETASQATQGQASLAGGSVTKVDREKLSDAQKKQARSTVNEDEAKIRFIARRKAEEERKAAAATARDDGEEEEKVAEGMKGENGEIRISDAVEKLDEGGSLEVREPSEDDDDKEDEDDDIFADAGRWDGLEDDEEEEGDDEEKEREKERKSLASAPSNATTNSMKRDWFAPNFEAKEDGDREGSEAGAALPAGLSNILTGAKAKQKAANAAATDPSSTSAENGNKGDGEAAKRENEASSGRLEGLSHSNLDSETAKILLEREREKAEKEEEKQKDRWKMMREKRRKKKGQANDGEKDG